MILILLSYPTFLFDLFLEAMAEILTKISLVFWSINNISKLTDL